MKKSKLLYMEIIGWVIMLALFLSMFPYRVYADYDEVNPVGPGYQDELEQTDPEYQEEPEQTDPPGETDTDEESGELIALNESMILPTALPNSIQMMCMQAQEASIKYDNTIALPDAFMHNGGTTPHGNDVRWFFTRERLPGLPPGYYPQAIYVLEPWVNDMWNGGEYQYSHDPISNSSMTDEQIGLLSYVLSNGQLYYYGPDTHSGLPDLPVESFSYYYDAAPSDWIELDRQISTQLAVWLIGSNIYSIGDPDRITMIGAEGSNDKGFAPSLDIAIQARSIINAAINAWDTLPSDINGKHYQMLSNHATGLYEVTITSPVFSDVTTPGQWGAGIVGALQAAGLTVNIGPAGTNTITITSPNKIPSSLTITVEVDDHLKSPVFFMNYRRSGETVWGQQMIMVDPEQLDSNSQISFLLSSLSVPNIATAATDQVDHDKVLAPNDKVVVIDEVKYFDLEPSEEYVLQGIIYEKTSGRPLYVNATTVTAEKTFTPTTPSGTVQMAFEFNASALQGKTLVVFQTLFHNNAILVTHHDIDNLDQTVRVRYDLPKTGDVDMGIVLLISMIAFVLLGGALSYAAYKGRFGKRK